ncbi:MAG: class II glutamine amidotransferase [Myxococcaceae bacterium]|jgi:hypothetical protein|nr:class II glutamine amidotransferase [Myxococcaceae bacterium]MCA3011735.1 class II glutamine amidotransferase [Myxococcaceae bacterium]
MTRLFAIATLDPTLMRCELSRARGQVALDDEGLVLGLGAWDDGQLVQRRYGVAASRADMWELPSSEVALYGATPPLPGRPIDDVAQPFRWRSWLFCMAGVVPGAARARERLAEQLPDFLQRVFKGPSVEEAAFVTFLAELRSVGRMEDPRLEAPLAAELLGRAADHVERAAAHPHRVPLAMVATNGSLVVATARGAQALAYRLLDGEGACARCGLSGDEKAPTALVRDHRRRRSVLLATHPLEPSAWQPVPADRVLAVSRSLDATLA